MPYFSIILPIYNVAPYLERCINSIFAQSFKDYEIILVDDGSTDTCPQICDEYAKRAPNVRVIHKANGGLSSARNAGFEIAEGEYIWWVDSDDWIEKDALKELYEASCNNHPEIVKFNHFFWAPKRQPVLSSVAPGMHTGTQNIEKLVKEAFCYSRKYHLSAWGHIYKRDFLVENNIPFVSERIVGSEDYLFNLCVLPYATTVCVLPAILYNYEMRVGSLSKRYVDNLAGRYEELYRALTNQYQKRGILEQYQDELNFFFVWHLIRGVGILNEYCCYNGHSMSDGRKKVKKILNSLELRTAIKHFNTRLLTKKQKVTFWALVWKLEFFFYWIYVVKPKYKKL